MEASVVSSVPDQVEGSHRIHPAILAIDNAVGHVLLVCLVHLLLIIRHFVLEGVAGVVVLNLIVLDALPIPLREAGC
jgi:hypothetical protein